MKRILLCLPLLLLLMVCPARAARLDMRGVWVSTVYNLDWPSRPGLSESQLKAEADAVIAKGQEMLHTIRAENDAIPDQVLSGQMDELERLCIQIFKTVAEKPQKAGQIRKFMNYYLPTTLKMLANYRTMDQRGVSVTDMTEARSTLIRGMGMVLTACQKQLDNLYKDTLLDVSTDMDVLEQMLKRDGLTDDELGAATARTATAAQLEKTGAPTANASSSAADDDFVSFYNKSGSRK